MFEKLKEFFDSFKVMRKKPEYVDPRRIEDDSEKVSGDFIDKMNQPAGIGFPDERDAMIYTAMNRQYWRSIQERDKKPEIHQHVHFHGLDEKEIYQIKEKKEDEK